jgi:hypothetical protein
VDDERVRAYVSGWPRWAAPVLAGVGFGIAMGLSAKHDGDGWLGAGFMATSGIPFGLATAWWVPRLRRQRELAEAGIPADQLQYARLAASRGPLPAAPEVRAAALQITSYQLAEATKRRKVRILIGGVFLIGTVGAASEGSPWALLYALCGAALVYFHWYWPRQLRRRIELLGGDTATDQSFGDGRSERMTDSGHDDLP